MNRFLFATWYPFSLGSDRPACTMIVALGLAAVLLAIAYARKLRGPRSPAHHGRPPLPPGPTPLPFLGNVLGINKDAAHLTYTAWSKTYGTCFAPLNIVWVISMSSNRRHRLFPRVGPGLYLVELGTSSPCVARKALPKVL